MTEAAIQANDTDGVTAPESKSCCHANATIPIEHWTKRNHVAKEETTRIHKLSTFLLQCNCAEENRVTFATGTLTDDALSWWNAYAQPIGIEQANRIAWTELKRLLTNKYCPRTEIKKMEDEFYGLTPQQMNHISSNMEPGKRSRLMESCLGLVVDSLRMDIMDLIPFVGNVLCITQDLVLSGVRIATK
ncbi:hypothetical protein Tco_1420022 [Tanacetum coccineum]